MKEFILGMLASIAGGIAILLCTRVFGRWRRLLISALNRLAKADIERVFRNKIEAQSDIEQSIREAKDIAILTSRGNELQRSTFDSLFLHRPESRQFTFRILLPDTSIPKGQYDWTGQRERELAAFDSAFGGGLLHQQIATNASFLQPHIDAGKAQLRRFNAPHVGRVIIADGTAYYTPYRSDAHGRDCPVYKYRRNGEICRNYQRLFDQLWNASGGDIAEPSE